MSQPTASCPFEISELLTITVTWEAFQGFDGHGEPSYAPPVRLSAWVESRSQPARGGLTALRKREETVSEPQWDLFFNGDDENAQQIKLYDRFTVPGIGSDSTQTLQANRIDTIYGPNFDNTDPWLIAVGI